MKQRKLLRSSNITWKQNQTLQVLVDMDGPGFTAASVPIMVPQSPAASADGHINILPWTSNSARHMWAKAATRRDRHQESC